MARVRVRAPIHFLTVINMLVNGKALRLPADGTIGLMGIKHGLTWMKTWSGSIRTQNRRQLQI